MADNCCVVRNTFDSSGSITESFVDHHEWRYMMLAGAHDFAPYYLYYCVFCLKLEKRGCVEDGTSTEHR